MRKICNINDKYIYIYIYIYLAFVWYIDCMYMSKKLLKIKVNFFI
ncbi:MAG: hypothetical protein N7Q72_04190 [Spiroplasma sp. Tabriz.8]|nr:hypothetical protein [Spiroplasma sp. Tabriz.8]